MFASTTISLVPPDAVRLTAPPPEAVTGPETVIVPAFAMETSPPDSLIETMISGPVFTRLTSPDIVFVAVKLVT